MPARPSMLLRLPVSTTRPEQEGREEVALQTGHSDSAPRDAALSLCLSGQR